MLNIKFIPPGPMYSARRIKVMSENQQDYVLSNNQNLKIDTSGKYKLKFKLDYHKVTFQNEQASNENKFLFVYFKYRQYFPFNYIDLMFKSCLATKEVTEEEFLKSDYVAVYNVEKDVVDKKSDVFLKITTAAILLSLIQLGVLTLNLKISDALLWICSLTGFFGFVRLYLRNKELKRTVFLTRIIALILYSLVFVGATFYQSSSLVYLNIGALMFLLFQTIRYSAVT
ncbi:MAG: hypothetical protein ACSHXL_01415 [Bacteroidota bacterium]